jgi:transcriptional regulator with XRE-family HTH domain
MESPAEPIAFGRYLQAFRLERHISLEQVAEETRIGTGTLKAIEHEDFEHLPPDVFTRGFLRAYAEAVGADGSEAVRRYDAHRTMLGRSRETGPENERAPSDVRKRLILSLLLLIALMVGSILGYQHWAPQPDDASAPPPLQTQSTESPPASSHRSQPPSEASKRAPIPTVSLKHVLTISAHEDSWVKVVVDHGIPAEHKLKAGNEIKLEAQTSFNLLIGNAGGVKLTLDNKALPAPGRRGEMVNLNLP